MLALTGKSQVSIAPTALFIDNATRSASMFVNNPTDNDLEVEIKLIYGYSANDSLGKSYIHYDDSLFAQKTSLLPYVTIFPKKFTMKPKTQQTVRFVLKNTNNLPDGIFWSRIHTESGKVQEQLDSQNVDGVKVMVNMRMAMVTGVFYKKGEQDNISRIEIGNMEDRTDSTKLYLKFDLNKVGEYPYFGTAKFKILTDAGKELLTKEESFSLYKSAGKAFEFELNKFTPGTYKVDFEIVNENKIFPKEYLPKTSSSKVTKTFTIK